MEIKDLEFPNVPSILIESVLGRFVVEINDSFFLLTMPNGLEETYQSFAEVRSGIQKWYKNECWRIFYSDHMIPEIIFTAEGKKHVAILPSGKIEITKAFEGTYENYFEIRTTGPLEHLIGYYFSSTGTLETTIERIADLYIEAVKEFLQV